MNILNYISDSIAHLVDGLEKLTDNLLEEGVTAFQAVGAIHCRFLGRGSRSAATSIEKRGVPVHLLNIDR